VSEHLLRRHNPGKVTSIPIADVFVRLALAAFLGGAGLFAVYLLTL